MTGRERMTFGGGRIVVLGALLALSPAAAVDIYKWVDKEGRSHYSNAPPGGVAARRVDVPISVVPSASPVDTGAKLPPAEDPELKRLRQENEQLRKDLEALRHWVAALAANPPQPQMSYVPYPVAVIAPRPRHHDDKPRPHGPTRPDGPARANR